MDAHEFRAILECEYMEDPCRVLANAFWKTGDRLPQLECSAGFEDGVAVSLVARGPEGIHVFWNRNRAVKHAHISELEASAFIILHQDYFKHINGGVFSAQNPYFRLSHNLSGISDVVLPDGFSFAKVDTENQCDEASQLIGRCYANLHPDPDTVMSWTRHRVFDRRLWLWIMDDQNERAAALGIAEFDPEIREGSLEWIQVLPEYRGLGLGTALVSELLGRLKGHASFVTVSGEIDSHTRPEELYRACGFTGGDVWWLLRR